MKAQATLRLGILCALVIALFVPVETGSAQAQERVYRIAMMLPSIPVAEMREGGDVAQSAFLTELRRLGYVEGANLVIERRSPATTPEGLAEAAREIVALQPDAIFASTTTLVRSLKAATMTIPIVASTTNPVEAGLVASLARPGGNITGINFNAGVEIQGKRIEMLLEVVPGATRLAFLLPATSWNGVIGAEMRQAAELLGVTMIGAGVEDPIDEQTYRRAFAMAVREGAEAVIVNEGPYARVHGPLIIEMAAAAGLPVLYPFKELPQAGGLISYGPNVADLARMAAGQIDMLLRGANAADIPIQQPVTFELVINLITARALGLNVPATLLARANEVIQ